MLLGGVSQPLVVVGAAASDGPRPDRRRVTFRGDEALPAPWALGPCARESGWDLLPRPHPGLPVAGGARLGPRAAFHSTRVFRPRTHPRGIVGHPRLGE